jgi:hypothetical protein
MIFQIAQISLVLTEHNDRMDNLATNADFANSDPASVLQDEVNDHAVSLPPLYSNEVTRAFA